MTRYIEYVRTQSLPLSTEFRYHASNPTAEDYIGTFVLSTVNGQVGRMDYRGVQAKKTPKVSGAVRSGSVATSGMHLPSYSP